jgi:hypothetical protein
MPDDTGGYIIPHRKCLVSLAALAHPVVFHIFSPPEEAQTSKNATSDIPPAPELHRANSSRPKCPSYPGFSLQTWAIVGLFFGKKRIQNSEHVALVQQQLQVNLPGLLRWGRPGRWLTFKGNVRYFELFGIHVLCVMVSNICEILLRL